MSSIRLLIADDHQFFRQGLRQACEAEGGFEIVGEAENGQEAVEMARRLQPDVILMDIQMPLLDGVQATRLITEENRAARVIVLTVYQQDEYVFEAIKAGAWGYLLKHVQEEVLADAIRSVHRGDVLIDSLVAAAVLQEFRRLSRINTPTEAEETERQVEYEKLEELTVREMEILRLVAQGQDNHAIARRLNMSKKTVANRLSAIYQKLQVNSRVQATLYALRRGWAGLDDE